MLYESQQIGTRADEMMLAREARVLAWSLGARMVFLGLMFLLTVLHLVGAIDPGVAAETDADALGGMVIAFVGMALVGSGLSLTLRKYHLIRVGFWAVILDLVLLAILPVLWLYTVNTPDGSAGFLMKNELAILGVVFIVINSLALRPLYPALMTGGLLLIHLVIAWFVIADARTVLTSEFVSHFYTSAVNPGIFVLRLIILALVGSTLTLLAWVARKNVQDAVALEVANMDIREEQSRMIFESKMAALSGLVAGVAHEVNSPLGAVQSSIDTVERVADRLVSEANYPDRLLKTLQESGTVAKQGTERIDGLVRSLREFARLDEAEVQKVDVRTGLETTLTMINPDLKEGVEVIRDFGEVPEIVCRPKEINQVFIALMTFGFESMDGVGIMRLKTATDGDVVVVEIEDSGPGMSEDRLGVFFEIGFDAGGSRVSLDMGVPLARLTVVRHGGEVSVRSEAGEGTSFRITLPVEGVS